MLDASVPVKKRIEAKWLILLAVMLGTIVAPIDASIVNTVLPSITTSFRTDIAKHWPADKEANTPAAAGRFGEPNEIATTALYLASDHSKFTTGALIRVDGGRP